MSEVKDRHCCGECKYFGKRDCPWQQVAADDEACLAFEPKGGWQE